ncbi:hypothetical protein AAE478_010194 [Parahypoxylon ruwenzoriense]
MSKIWTPLSQEGAEEMNSTEDSTVKVEVRGATIEEETLLLPHPAILCLKGASHFLQLIGGIPSMTADIVMLLVSYLQMFDSRCRQLILGAGALRSAGLKNITTTHLALTSRALSFIATIIPHILDKVRRVFQEHRDAIYQKLVEIMASRARMLSKKARETEWCKESAEDIRKYMADLVKDTGKLYKALNKYLPERAVVLVMVPVFASYQDQLGEKFKEADPETETGRDCMLRDVNHLIDMLGKVKGFGDLGTYLMKIIEGKEI